MKDVDIITIAQTVEKTSRQVRTAMQRLDQSKQGEIETLRYCGALLSLVSSTLCELHEHLHPVFEIGIVNGILKEWGADELQ